MHEMSKKKVIGITGSMGSGKSAVVNIIKENYPCIDCDQINADLLLPDALGYHALYKEGLISLNEDRTIDKIHLGQAMFKDPLIKERVEAILHPLIFEQMHAWINQQTSDLVFVEMPLLFEVGAQDHFDSIWCICASEKIALSRLEKYRHISIQEAKRRWAHQMDPKIKQELSNLVIYNDGSLKQLRQKVLNAIEKEKSWV